MHIIFVLLKYIIHHFDVIVKTGYCFLSTKKPVELLKMYIENSTEEGEWILDPFAGSGSTMAGFISTHSEYACGGSLVTNSDRRTFSSEGNVYCVQEDFFDEINGNSSEKNAISYDEIVSEFSKALKQKEESTLISVNSVTLDAFAENVVNYKIENKQLQKDIESAVKINV